MLEILALIFLTQQIGQKAASKGLSTFKWKAFTVLAWVLCEFIGIFIAMAFFGQGNYFAIYSIAIMSAIGGYLLVKSLIDKQPDPLDDDIEKIGQ
ncbi:MAG: hypothetical protein U0T56_07090 [Ferruginibacter sp.]